MQHWWHCCCSICFIHILFSILFTYGATRTESLIRAAPPLLLLLFIYLAPLFADLASVDDSEQLWANDPRSLQFERSDQSSPMFHISERFQLVRSTALIWLVFRNSMNNYIGFSDNNCDIQSLPILTLLDCGVWWLSGRVRCLPSGKSQVWILRIPL